MNIKTWQERLEPPDHGLGIRAVDFAMQAEIDELRAALASAESLQIATYTQVVVLDGKLEEQCKVLEQALEALQSLFSFEVDEHRGERCASAITAIQEQLNEHN